MPVDHILHPDNFNDIINVVSESYLIDGGGESIWSRDSGAFNIPSVPSQVLRLCGFKAKRTNVVSQVTELTGTTAAAATPSLIRMGLFHREPDGITYTLVAATPHDAALFAAANTAYTKAFSAPYKKIAGDEYLVGTLVVSAAATPSFMGPATVLHDNFTTSFLRTSPVRGGIIAAQADLPATLLSSNITSVGFGYIHGLLS